MARRKQQIEVPIERPKETGFLAMSAKIPLPTDRDRADVAHAGLCASCEHLRVLRSRRSTFVHCGRAAVDPRFPRYPPLPVQVCPGYTDTLTTRNRSAGSECSGSDDPDAGG